VSRIHCVPQTGDTASLTRVTHLRMCLTSEWLRDGSIVSHRLGPWRMPHPRLWLNSGPKCEWDGHRLDNYRCVSRLHDYGICFTYAHASPALVTQLWSQMWVRRSPIGLQMCLTSAWLRDMSFVIHPIVTSVTVGCNDYNDSNDYNDYGMYHEWHIP